MTSRILPSSDRHRFQNHGNSRPSLQDHHHHGDQASCRPVLPTKEEGDSPPRAQIQTSEDLLASMPGLDGLGSRMIAVAVDQAPGTIIADPHLSVRTKTLHLCLHYDRSHPWNKAFARDLVAKV